MSDSDKSIEAGHGKHGVLADHDILGEKAVVSHEEAGHIGELTEEEKVCISGASWTMAASMSCKVTSSDKDLGHRKETQTSNRQPNYASRHLSLPHELYRPQQLCGCPSSRS